MHNRVHPDYVEGCDTCKLSSIRFNTAGLKASNTGKGPTSGMTDREYARDMYEKRRAAGLPDPEPANAQAAKFAVPKGVMR